MFEGSSYQSVETILQPGDSLVLYSDGITEAEDPAGVPFDETGLEQAIATNASFSAAEMGTAVLKSVEHHAQDFRFSDDLTILILKRYSTL